MPSWQDWNNAIGEAVFSPGYAGRVVYLAIDREEIAAIGVQFGLDAAKAYDDFRDVMRRQVRWGWSSANAPCNYPNCLAELAVQVLAAFEMHDNKDATGKAYWIRLREFLGEPLEDKRPQRLTGKWHLEMWHGLARWANEKKAGQQGKIKLDEREDGHHLIAKPLGQCLLRRTDLDRLKSGLFTDHDPRKLGRYRGRGLQELVDEARFGPGSKFFTQHGLRVLRDPDRSAAAREQIVAEYERYLAPTNPPPSTIRLAPLVDQDDPASRQPSRSRNTLLLQIGRGGLNGGLFRAQDGRRVTSVGAALRRRQSPDDGAVLTIQQAGAGACFRGWRRCRVGDEVLLLIPEGDEPGWPKALGPFQGELTRYRPVAAGERPGWRTLPGLPIGWMAIRGRIKDDLDGIALLDPWAPRVDRLAANLRLAGGLLLRRRVWMLGAGPTVQVLGTSRFDFILVDGERLPLNADRAATLDLTVGSHVIHLPGRVTGGVRFRIEAAERFGLVAAVGWHRTEDGWPASTAERRRLAPPEGGATLHGPALIGDWPPRPLPSPPEPPPSTTPIELIALDVIRHLRLGNPPGPGPVARPVSLAWNSKHLLARALARAVAHPPLG